MWIEVGVVCLLVIRGKCWVIDLMSVVFFWLLVFMIVIWFLGFIFRFIFFKIIVFLLYFSFVFCNWSIGGVN